MSRSRRLAGIELAMRHFAVSIHIGLLVHAAYALEIHDVKSILRTQVAWVLCLNFTTDFLAFFLKLKRGHLGFSEDNAVGLR